MGQLLVEVGLSDPRVTARFDCFRETSKEDVAREFGVRGVHMVALKERAEARK